MWYGIVDRGRDTGRIEPANNFIDTDFLCCHWKNIFYYYCCFHVRNKLMAIVLRLPISIWCAWSYKFSFFDITVNDKMLFCRCQLIFVHPWGKSMGFYVWEALQTWYSLCHPMCQSDYQSKWSGRLCLGRTSGHNIRCQSYRALSETNLLR